MIHTTDRADEAIPKWTWIGLARSTHFQLTGSLIGAGIVCGCYWSRAESLLSSPFSDLGMFHGFVFGVAMVFAIVGPILFAFLMQELQSSRQERTDVYWKLCEAVASVREHVAALSPEGKIHYRLADRLLDIEVIRLDEIDNEFHNLVHSVHRIMRWAQRKSRGSRLSEKEVALGCALNRVEERLSMLGVNFVRRICVEVLKESVIKCLWCLGALVLLSVVALGIYSPQTQSVFFFAAASLSSFGIFITVELATLASQQVREVSPQPQDDSDDDDDVEGFADSREAG